MPNLNRLPIKFLPGYADMRVILLKLLLFYKRFISPLLLKRCRFYPSCSEYAYEAIEKKGAVRGIIYASIRILKCHPFHAGGYDPLNPVKNSNKKL